MKRLICLTIAASLGLAASAWGAPLTCLNHGIHCICPPPSCPDCTPPCEKGWHHCSCRKTERAHRLIEQLSCPCCCDRIKAAEKLGCRLHADFCCDPEVLTALVHALQCDPCWEVRKAAAWSIAYQGARTELGVMSLYLASKLDPHYMVRDAAIDAMSVLLVCRRECFKDVFAAGDELVKSLKGKYKPGSPECVQLHADCLSHCGGMATVSVVSPSGATPAAPAVMSPHTTSAPMPTGTPVAPKH